MGADTRKKDVDWNVTNSNGNCSTWEHVTVAVLMDIRDELKTLNRLLHCQNFQNIPRKLDAIRLNTRKVKRTKKI